MNKQNYDRLTFNQLAERNAEHVTAIARLEAQVKQLAAENAFLMHRIDWPKQQCPTTGDVTDVEPDDFIPSTDAAIAPLRAEGVEMLAAIAGNECKRYKSINDRAGLRKWKSIVILCSDFATRLRRKSEMQS